MLFNLLKGFFQNKNTSKMKYFEHVMFIIRGEIFEARGLIFLYLMDHCKHQKENLG